jgi:hypothetical protein
VHIQFLDLPIDCERSFEAISRSNDILRSDLDILKTIITSGADCLFIGIPTPRKERLLLGSVSPLVQREPHSRLRTLCRVDEKFAEFELTFSDSMHELNAGDGN